MCGGAREDPWPRLGSHEWGRQQPLPRQSSHASHFRLVGGALIFTAGSFCWDVRGSAAEDTSTRCVGRHRSHTAVSRRGAPVPGRRARAARRTEHGRRPGTGLGAP
ncbi:predicted protein [Streptomyces viridochromogenes DSM 40736]|uniref:Predicted protein n=1 Tax=Streptomyces viridochromogenes (strain DSM 40736 / JCM 4977 / BCRC 1201 / Tue 494) TaxID=591159 RepID=D9XIK3_STRVT|nr:predicted protein [Streptomyces viridochromogenes DSM 40736]